MQILHQTKRDMTKEKTLLSQYIERVKSDYPEDDKLYLTLEQFVKEQTASLQSEVERLKSART